MSTQRSLRRAFVVGVAAALAFALAAPPAWAFWVAKAGGVEAIAMGQVPAKPDQITWSGNNGVVTVTNETDAGNAYQNGLCGTSGAAGGVGLPNGDQSGAHQVPFSLRWKSDTSGLVDHYEVTMALTYQSSNSLYASGTTTNTMWSSNDNPATFGDKLYPATTGTTFIGATNGANATNASSFLPAGMTTSAPASTSGVTNPTYGSDAPRMAGYSTTWEIPVSITYAGNVKGSDKNGTTIAGQSGASTWGVNWVFTLPTGWSSNVAGTVSVTAVSRGGWKSDPLKVYWYSQYGTNSSYCSTQQIDGITVQQGGVTSASAPVSASSARLPVDTMLQLPSGTVTQTPEAIAGVVPSTSPSPTPTPTVSSDPTPTATSSPTSWPDCMLPDGTVLSGDPSGYPIGTDPGTGAPRYVDPQTGYLLPDCVSDGDGGWEIP